MKDREIGRERKGREGVRKEEREGGRDRMKKVLTMNGQSKYFL